MFYRKSKIHFKIISLNNNHFFFAFIYLIFNFKTNNVIPFEIQINFILKPFGQCQKLFHTYISINLSSKFKSFSKFHMLCNVQAIVSKSLICHHFHIFLFHSIYFLFFQNVYIHTYPLIIISFRCICDYV